MPRTATVPSPGHDDEATMTHVDELIRRGRSQGHLSLPELRAAFERAGRDPASARVVPLGVAPDRGKLDHYASLGVDEVLFGLPSGDRDTVLPVLDRYAQLIH